MADNTLGEDPLADNTVGKIIGSLCTLVLAGTLVTAWILYYTDWFPIVGGVIALGGAFAWVSVVLHLVSDERKKEIQKYIEGRVLLKSLLWKGVIMASLLFILAATSLTTRTVVIQSYRDDVYRSISIGEVADREADSRPIREHTLPGRSSRKFLLFGNGPFRVKLSGLPALTVYTRPFRRKVVASPNDFIRPVVLLRPTLPLSQVAASAKRLTLVVRRGSDTLLRQRPFLGQAVWIGCDRDIAIPERIRQDWDPKEATQWLPAMAANRELTLHPDEQLRIHIETANGDIYVPEIRKIVESALDARNFVQEVVLDIPR